MADPVEALRGTIALWQEEGRGEYSYDIAAQLCRDARALLDALPEMRAKAWDSGVTFTLQMINPKLINDTWNAHNPYRREAADELAGLGQEINPGGDLPPFRRETGGQGNG